MATVASSNNRAVQILQLSDLHGAIEVGSSFGAALLASNCDADRKANPATIVTIDVENQRIRFGDQEVTFYIRESARGGLISGTLDPIAELLEWDEQINATAKALPYV